MIYIPVEGFFWEGTDGVTYHESVNVDGSLTITAEIAGKNGIFITAKGIIYQSPNGTYFRIRLGEGGVPVGDLSSDGALYLGTDGCIFIDAEGKQWHRWILDNGTLAKELME